MRVHTCATILLVVLCVGVGSALLSTRPRQRSDERDLLGGGVSCHTDPMRREDAEARRDRLQTDDQDHTYPVRERPAGEWEVVRIDLAHGTSGVTAERGTPAERQDDPRPSLIRQIPPYGAPG